MTNKEAITYLEWLSDIDFTKEYPKYPIVTKQEQVEALQMAITALDQLDNNSTKPNNSTATQSNGIESKVKGLTACRVPEDDCISRQAAIDALDCINGVEEVLKALPSAQPEIIRCKSCMYGVDYYHEGDCYCSNPKWGLTYFGGSWTFYCADAERRTDE